MNDLKLDLESRDLVINSKGDLELLNEDSQVARQTLEINLLTYKGEWFLDIQYGVPYFQDILAKGASKSLIDGIFRQKILESYKIDSIQKFNSSISNEVYTLNELTATTTEGQIVSITNQVLI